MAYRVKERYYAESDNFGEAYIIVSDNSENNTNFEPGTMVRLVPVDTRHLEKMRDGVRFLLPQFSDRIEDSEIDGWFAAALDGFNNTEPFTSYQIDEVPFYGMLVPNLVSQTCANLLDLMASDNRLTDDEEKTVPALKESFTEHARILFEHKDKFVEELV